MTFLVHFWKKNGINFYRIFPYVFCNFMIFQCKQRNFVVIEISSFHSSQLIRDKCLYSPVKINNIVKMRFVTPKLSIQFSVPKISHSQNKYSTAINADMYYDLFAQTQKIFLFSLKFNFSLAHKTTKKFHLLKIRVLSYHTWYVLIKQSLMSCTFLFPV